MPIYRCPRCRRVVIQLTVLAKGPEQVTCPHCHSSFDPRMAGQASRDRAGELQRLAELGRERRERPDGEILDRLAQLGRERRERPHPEHPERG